MGLISWLKKEIDGANFQRRESAPPRPVKNFDPNRSRDDAYVKAFSKFNEWRANERNKRLSEANTISEHIDADQNVSKETMQADTDEIIYRDDEYKDYDDLLNNSNNHININRNDNNYLYDTVDERSKSIPRHSLPANMPKLYANRSIKLKKRKSSRSEHQTIHEVEVKDFEGSHCYGNLDRYPQSPGISNSPPTKFYKQNSNPYPENNFENTTPASRGALRPLPSRHGNDFSPRSCPVKPKRSILKPNESKGRDLTTEITEAHFNGSYKNFEIHSPRNYDGSKSPTGLNRSMRSKNTRSGEISRNSQKIETNDDPLGMKQYSAQYQTIINKHGDVVEYAVPYCEVPAVTTRQSLDIIPSADEMSDEVFIDDQNECEKLINENFQFLSNAEEATDEVMKQIDANISRRSLKHHWKPLKTNGSVMVTDLDKSFDSSRTLDDQCKSQEGLDDLNSLSKWSVNLARSIHPKTKSQNDLLDFVDTFRSTVPVCQLNEIKSKMSVLRNTFVSPLEIMSGIFRKSTVSLRSYAFTEDDAKDDRCLIAEQAIRRDFDILKQIRHRDIIILMAVSCNAEFKDITLILEPADYTLHYYLHQMNEKLTIFESISIVQQVANAALYLQECGFIHSNISSHSVLMSKCPKHVKLTSFELATSVLPDTRIAIEAKFKRSSKLITYETDSLRGMPTSTLLMRHGDKYVKEHYRELSKNMRPSASARTYTARCVNELEPQFLPYCVEYRQQLSVFNYQPPELLVSRERFVFPTRNSDVYSLTLLLWELLNHCVPFVIFNEIELEHLYAVNKAVLPIFEEDRCVYFKQIFKYGFECDPVNRSMPVHHLISLLEDIKFDIHAEVGNPERGMHSKSTILYDSPRINQKIPTENIYENAEEIFATELDPIGKHSNAKKQMRLNKHSPSVEAKIESTLSNVTSSTLYRSILDHNKLLSPRRADNANIYERSSTIKKRIKPSGENKTKRNITELFDQFGNNNSKMSCEDSPKLNENLIANGENDMLISDLEDENGVIGPITVREIEFPSKKSIKEQQAMFMNEILDGSLTENRQEAKGTDEKEEPDKTEYEKCSDHTQNTYKFIIDHYSIPQTVIARTNKIRRNTWLSSDQSDISDSTVRTPPTVISAEFNKPSADENKSPNESTHSNKKLNVSIKIIHKQVTPQERLKSEPIELDITGVDMHKSMAEEEESPSVLSRIKFFSSLETAETSPTLSVNKTAPERQSQAPLSDRKESLPDRRIKSGSDSPPTNHKQLLQDITDISEEIQSLTANRLDSIIKMRQSLKPVEKQNNVTVACSQPFIDELNNSLKSKMIEKNIWPHEKDLLVPNKKLLAITTKLFSNDVQQEKMDENNDQTAEKDDRRHSVLETVQQFEKVSSPKNMNSESPFKKIENKLFNEKINNSDIEATMECKLSSADERQTENDQNDDSMKTEKELAREANEKIISTDDKEVVQENVLNVVCLPEVENESGAIVLSGSSALCTPIKNTSFTTKSNNQTLIKRTVYRESIISGTDVDIADLEKIMDSQSVQTAATTKSSSTTKLTTRVTLNLRRFKRRSSDVGIFPDSGFRYDECLAKQTAQEANSRHSICGNEIFESVKNYRDNYGDMVTTTSGRSLREIFNTQKVVQYCDEGIKSNVSALVTSNLLQNSMNMSNADLACSSRELLSSLRARRLGNMEIQSIEDLYIDDDFCQGISLAANMKLVTSSDEMLNDIDYDFDIISTHIFEETKASVTTSNDFFDSQIKDTANAKDDDECGECEDMENDKNVSNLNDCSNTKKSVLEH